jgi:CheY-like chemotaxis protein
MSIVVVDDELDLVELVSQVLEDEGYRVLSFSHPLDLTDLPNTGERPGLFLIDIMLPAMDGIALAASLRDRGFETTPKIAMSASHQCIDAARASSLFQATLCKPFEIDDLLDCIEQHSSA